MTLARKREESISAAIALLALLVIGFGLGYGLARTHRSTASECRDICNAGEFPLAHFDDVRGACRCADVYVHRGVHQ